MSLSYEVTVWCDVCNVWVQATGTTAKKLRAQLKKEGWTSYKRLAADTRRLKITSNIIDLCPSCLGLNSEEKP